VSSARELGRAGQRTFGYFLASRGTGPERGRNSSGPDFLMVASKWRRLVADARLSHKGGTQVTTEAIIDWVVLLPAGMKLASAIAVLLLVVAYTCIRPGDPTA
jgi:hypothetical protein